MSVSSSTRRFDYVGNNRQTASPMTNALVYDATHIAVYLAGVLQVSGYTVTGVGSASGPTVTFAVAPGTSVAVLLIRTVPLTQQVTLGVAGAFPAKTVEQMSDLSVMAEQQLNEVDQRSLKVPVSSVISGAGVELPDPAVASNRDKVLHTKTDGTGFDLVSASSAAFISPLTTKGDLVTYDSAATRLAVGTDGQLLTADSAQTKGIKWADNLAILKSVVTT